MHCTCLLVLSFSHLHGLGNRRCPGQQLAAQQMYLPVDQQGEDDQAFQEAAQEGMNSPR